ncbi:YceI family protein, partial [bacterium]|nr:YceI family protein [bacterium]
MKKTFVVFLLAVVAFSTVDAQKYITRNGTVSFFSTTPIEDIKGTNNQVTSLLDTQGGGIVFMALMKGFQFDKALMQEHFNEKYVESEKYPKAQFKGSIENFEEIDFTKDGTYDITVSGPLTLHGETNVVTTEGSLVI